MLLVGCSNNGSYWGYINDKNGEIQDTVLDIYRYSKNTSSQYTVISFQLGKSSDDVKDATLTLSDVIGYMNNNPVNPLTFAKSINSWADESKSYNYAGSPSDTFVVARDATTSVYPYCYLCFEKGAIDKNVVIKVKGQEINHDANNPTKIKL